VITELWGLYSRETKKTYRNFAVLFVTLVQPIMWLAFFGSSFSDTPKQFLQGFFHTSNYIAYLLPGELSTSMLFVGMFSSLSLIQDKRFGYLKRLLVTKAPKSSIFLSKVLGATTRGLIQVPVVFATALAFGVNLPLNPLGLTESVLALVFLGLGLSSVYVMITMRSADWQTPGAVSNFINLPLMFSSTALFPKTFFPSWMQYLSDVNPISFSANIGRAYVLSGDPNWTYLAYLAAFVTLMIALGASLSRKWLTAE
jgi:ABC-2 type transport system permease protein